MALKPTEHKAPKPKQEKSSTALKKTLSPINVWAMALGCMIGWGAFVMPGNTFLQNAGPLGMGIAIGIAMAIMIIVAINYSFMIEKYPQSGGEFTYTLKTFGRKPAFVCSWFLGLTYTCVVPLNATALALIGRAYLPGIFQVGFHYSVAGYDVYLGELVLAIGVLVLFAALSIKGVKFAGIFQTVLVIALVVGIAMVVVAAYLSPDYDLIGLEPAFSPDMSPAVGIIAIVAIVAWMFVGFDTVPQSVEEAKFSVSKTRVIMIVSLVFSGLAYVALNTVSASVVPSQYASWADYINDLSNLTGMLSLPTFNAAYTLLGNAGLILLGLAVCAASLSGIIGFYMAASRLLFAMARENVLPAWFGKLDGKNSTPRNALLFVMVLSIIAPFFGRTALNWIVSMAALGAAFGYGFTSASSLKHAIAEKRPARIILGAIGVLVAIMFVVLLLVPIPGLNCSLSSESYVCLLIWIALGAIFYAVSKKRRQAHAATP